MKLIPTWVYAVVFAALLAAIGVQTVRVAGLKTDIANMKATHAGALAKQSDQRAENERIARDKERKLTQDAANFAQEKQDEINRIESERDAALASLRNRPERPTAVTGSLPGAPADCKGATGAELFRSDAEFLTREAARADKLRTALDQCYRQYDAGQKMNAQP
jgi:hypothetical protein